MNKPKPKTLDDMALKTANRLVKDVPHWPSENQTCYRCGIFDGYKAGFKAGRRGRK